MQKSVKLKLVPSIAFLFILLLSLYVHAPGFYLDTKYRDVYFAWAEGRRIASGVNPYARFADSDMVHNEKLPTRLPLIYLLTAFLTIIGFRDFASFMVAWRIMVLIFDLAIAVFLYNYSAKKNREGVGLFAVFFWLFSRWSLYTWEIGNSECLILFLMILSIYYWNKKPLAAGLLFGASLGLKHFGVLFLPVLLFRNRDLKEAGRRLLFVLAIPAVVSLPFFLWGPNAFLRAIFFNAVRQGSSHLLEDAQSLFLLFGRLGILSRLFIMAAFLLFWFAAIRRQWNLWLCAALSFLLFVSFNPVLFTQYFSWMVPFFGLFLIDLDSWEGISRGELDKSTDKSTDGGTDGDTDNRLTGVSK